MQITEFQREKPIARVASVCMAQYFRYGVRVPVVRPAVDVIAALCEVSGGSRHVTEDVEGNQVAC
jgi:hypothetical protein